VSVEYEVIAVRYGTLVARRSAMYLHSDACGEPGSDERLDYFFYVLRRDGETIVLGAVTNGCTEDEIRETPLQAPVHCGMPAGLEAFRIAERTLRESPATREAKR
jgi:hypothetical protein